MIQFNLLPDVKLEFIKAQKMRRLVASISLIVTALSVTLLIVTVVISQIQKKHLSDLTRDVSSESSKLKAVPGLDGILTVQNQLESLTALHQSKIAASNLFGYLNQVTPTSVSISNFTTDFTQDTATITGSADSLTSINQYVDTLKLTTYTTATSTAPLPAFNNVVLSNFGLSSSGGTNGGTASYTITLGYDKTLFDITQKVVLAVPSYVTTRSDVAQPSDLFKDTPTTTSGGN